MDLQIGQTVWYVNEDGEIVESNVKSISKVRQDVVLTNGAKFERSRPAYQLKVKREKFCPQPFIYLLDKFEDAQERATAKKQEMMLKNKKYIRQRLLAEFCDIPHWLHPEDYDQVVELIYDLKEKRRCASLK